MTVRCRLLVLLFLVSSVVSGPTRGAAESPDDSPSAAPSAAEAPGEAMTSQPPETPTPQTATAMVAPATETPAPETTARPEPEVGANISLTEPIADVTASLTEPSSSSPETASSTTVEASAKQTSSEEPPATTETERCAEPEAGVTEGSATDICGSSGSKDTDSSSGDNGCIVDDHEYPDGARVPGLQDPCRPCFCHRKRVTCVELRCYTRRGCKPLFKAGICCPTYDHCPPVAMVNASGEVERNLDESEGATGFDGVTTDQITDETATGPVAHLVDSSAHKEDDSEEESRSDQDDDDSDDHDHSHHHHRKHHMHDPVTPLTSSATKISPSTSFPFLVRGRAGVEVR